VRRIFKEVIAKGETAQKAAAREQQYRGLQELEWLQMGVIAGCGVWCM